MQKIGLWHITYGKPKKIRDSGIDLEKHLEDWIESDPELLQAGLEIVGRQLNRNWGHILNINY